MADSDLSEQLSPAQSDTRDQFLLDLEAVLSNSHGQHVVLWFLELCNVYGAQFTGEDAGTNFNLGKRDIGIRVISKLSDLNPATYPMLLLGRAREMEPKETAYVADAEDDE